MGFEYKIRFTVPPGFSSERLLQRLPDSKATEGKHQLYDFKVDSDGFYFLDYGKSQIASVAFRMLVDEALQHSQNAIIEEL
jgi:hypothetical protein